MNLDTVTVNLRPRTPWEAIDCGFLLARRWYWQLWLLWLLNAVVLLLLLVGISLLLPGLTAKWTLLLFWITKPLCEPPLLSWISRALFGSSNRIKDTLRATWQEFSAARLGAILLNRCSPFRSFSLPVLLLEQLKGQERRTRLKLLKEGYETAMMLSLGACCLELILTLSLMTLLFWFVPDELRWVDFGSFVFTPDNWLLLFSYVISCSLCGPLYVCAGFMLYISRRVELEAWDIEIGFKRIRQRLTKRRQGAVRTVGTCLLLLFCSLPLNADCGWALEAEDPETARAAITTVLEDKTFGEKVTKYRWVAKKKDTPQEDSIWAEFLQDLFKKIAAFLDKLTPLLAKYGELLLWCFLGIIITLLLLKFSQLRAWLDQHLPGPRYEPPPPQTMFGMDLRPESLPDDLGAACSRLLREGDTRAAMSLLYRGTLSGLINHHRLEIHASFTEKECCKAVQRKRPAPEARFFHDLTRLWSLLAYGHRHPEKEQCCELINQWQQLYGVQV